MRELESEFDNAEHWLQILHACRDTRGDRLQQIEPQDQANHCDYDAEVDDNCQDLGCNIDRLPGYFPAG